MILRRACLSDAQFVWQCRAELDGSVALAVGNRQDYAPHLAWMHFAVADPKRLFLITEDNGLPLGYVRIEPDVEGWRTSLCVASGARNQGIGVRSIKHACTMAQTLRFIPIFADIHDENVASQTVFKKSGFELAGPTTGMLRYSRYWLSNNSKDQTHV